MNAQIRRIYFQLRAKGWTATNALASAKTRARFEELDQDLVKLEVEPEIDCYDDSYIDTWTDVSSAKREAERKKLHARIAREGCWILVSYWRPDLDAEWEMADSVGGFIGDDYENSGYDDDLRDAALSALATHLESETCELARGLSERATYASVV